MPAASPAHADSPFLLAVLAALKKRSRALKHGNAIPTIDRIIEITDGEPLERIEIEFRTRKRQSLRILVWEDRAIWVHACEAISKAGWKFQFTDSGRLIGHASERELVAALEASLSAMFEMTADDLDRLTAIWGPLLAHGPRPV